MKTLIKNMTLSQQLGMVTLKNTLMVLSDYAVNFQLTTTEVTKTDDEYVVKKIHILYDAPDIFNSDGDLMADSVTDIVFMLYKNVETRICFYNVHGEIDDVDCFKGFDWITATWVK